MPPKGDPLKPEELAILKEWISAGAQWAGGALVEKTPGEAAAIADARRKAGMIRELAVYPPKITLETERDSHQLVATVTYNDDTTQDVTGIAKTSLADPAIARLEGDVLRPLKDGTTELMVTHAGKTTKIPVEVKGATTPRPVSFNLDVMPVFMREGCNTGGCHGASRGQDRFRLSLFGFDPKSDYQSLTREMIGRRLNLAAPDQSFLLLKSTEAVPHTGGKLFDVGSPSYNTLMEWITNGAPSDPEEIAKVVDVEIYPKQIVMEGEGSTQQLTVVARYSDGSDRDVTKSAVFVTNNEPSAPVTRDGKITAAKRGEAFVMARFDTFTVGAQVLAIPRGLDYRQPQAVTHNYVDEHSEREAPQAPDSPLRPMRGPHLPAPGLPRHHRHPPHPGGVSGFRRRPVRRQARQGDRLPP